MRLGGIKGLAIVRLDKGDIVRHRLVQNIVEAYARDARADSSRHEPDGPDLRSDE